MTQYQTLERLLVTLLMTRVANNVKCSLKKNYNVTVVKKTYKLCSKILLFAAYIRSILTEKKPHK